MASRKKVLLKVIILGDSGYVLNFSKKIFLISLYLSEYKNELVITFTDDNDICYQTLSY